MAPFRRVYITGFMGCGKTTAGKKLASELGWKFIDLDHEIERRENRPVKMIFSDSGEEYFRKAESSALQGLEIVSDSIISTGGGTPCFNENLQFMHDTGVVIYLRMTPGQLKNRLAEKKGQRPLLKDLAESELTDYISGKLREREPFYLQANLVIDGPDPDLRLLAGLIPDLFK
jgi:shikimate kinase